MSNTNICTWFYGDTFGEETIFPNNRGISSEKNFQNVYWQCIVVFFSTSIRHNPQHQHILYTNVTYDHIPDIKNFSVKNFLKQHHIKVINVNLTYKTPKKFHHAFGNQFYIFDILDYIKIHDKSLDNNYLIFDSDCIWIKPVESIVRDIKKHGVLAYKMPYSETHEINGLSRTDMKVLFEELEGKKIDLVPYYYGGEAFVADIESIRKISDDFTSLWKILLERFKEGKKKFNEEAHSLSYLFYRLGVREGNLDKYTARIWTLPTIHSATVKDFDLTIWHVPSEKKHGIKKLYYQAINPGSKFWRVPLGVEFAQYCGEYLQIPQQSLKRKLYYSVMGVGKSIYKKLKKVD